MEGEGVPSKARTARTWIGRILLAAVVVPFFWVWWVWPPPIWYRWFWPRETAFMALRHYEALATGSPTLRVYQPVSLRTVSPILRSAVLAGEDQRFLEHDGIDYVELRKAIGYRRDSFSWLDASDRAELERAIRRSWSTQGGLRGASTITQQLAKNLYLSPSRNPLRKLKELVTAWRLEHWLGKERILELYLNVAELGPGIWGVEAAAREYFGKGAGQLSLEEAAALAATLPFPRSSNPEHRPGRMRWRQNMIIRWLRGEPVEIPRAPVLDTIPLRLDTIPIRLDSIRIRLDTAMTKPDTLRRLDSLQKKLDSLRKKTDTLPRDWGRGTSQPA